MTLFQTKLILLVALILVGSVCVFAQAPEAKTDERTAQAVFEDANGYLGRRYQEFNKQNLPYDPKIEAQVKKDVEQSVRFAEESPLPDESELYTDIYANPL